MSIARVQIVRLAIAYFFISASFVIARDIFVQDYDSDIDHHMYFGQRLLFGELIWTREIYDKFPIIQYLFAIPAYFESPRVWFLLSALTLLISTWALYHATPFLMSLPRLPNPGKMRSLIPLLSSSFYLYLSTITPPSINHVTSFTVSCLIVSVCLMTKYINRDNKTGKIISHVIFVASFIFASIALSIRPYLAIPSIQIILWIVAKDALNLFRNDLGYSNGSAQNLLQSGMMAIRRTAIWTMLTVTSLVIVNFVPYLLSNNIDVIYNGISHNSQKLNPQLPLDILSEQWNTVNNTSNWYYIFLILSSCVIIIYIVLFIYKKHLHRSEQIIDELERNIIYNSGLDLLFGVLFPLASLEIIILSRHWWDHYWQMFIVFGLLHFMVLVRFAFVKFPSAFLDRNGYSYIVATCALAIGTAVGSNANHVAHHPQAGRLQEIRLFLNERRADLLAADFLDIGDMYSHWKLRESRHGFPHTQNIQHIILGWYSSLHRIQHLPFPYTREELCNQVKEHGPSVVFMNFAYMFSCLLSKESNYTLTRNTAELIIFVRDPMTHSSVATGPATR